MIDYTKRSRAQSQTQAVAYDEGLRQYMLKVFNNMALGLGLTGVIAYITASTSLGLIIATTPLYWILAIAELALVWYFAARAHTMEEGKARTIFYIYSALNGLTLSVIFLAYTQESIARAFFVTAAVFGAMSLYGYTTKRDLTGLGSFLFMGLIGIIIASIVNIFMHSSMLSFITSVAGVIIFTGLTAYDVQKIKQIYHYAGGDIGSAAIRGSLSLYLDFINLLIMLLHFMGNRR